jgi:hypothetical protein
MIFEEKLYDRVGGLQFDQIIKIDHYFGGNQKSFFDVFDHKFKKELL